MSALAGGSGLLWGWLTADATRCHALNPHVLLSVTDTRRACCYFLCRLC